MAAGARSNPGHPALYYFDEPIAAEQLQAESDALACALLARGVRRGDRVATYLQNIPQFVISILATWKVGAIVTVASPMLREAELRKLLDDTGASVLIALDSLYQQVAAQVVGGVRTLHTVVTASALDYLGPDLPSILVGMGRPELQDTEDFAALLASHAGERPSPVSLVPQDTAILAHTSGTTGPAKGAMLSHGNVVFNSRTFRDWRSLTESDTILAMSPLFHVTGLIGHVGLALLTSAPLIVAYRFDAGTMLDLIERHRPTFTVAAITAFIALLEHPGFARERVASLTKVISGGAPIPPAVLDRYERATGTYIYNGYGLTETTSPSHQVPVSRRAPVHAESGSVSVGVPVPGTECRLVDENGLDVPVGAPGELLIRGPQVMAGFWNNPEETAVAMVDGYVRTGDIAVRDDDGWFFIVDRKKDQINVSGYKVWPVEVERVLYEHPAVREAAVVGVSDDYSGEAVKAFVALRAGVAVDPAELIAFCKERMAAYKYPRTVELVDELPKSAAGKILRGSLRDRGKSP